MLGEAVALYRQGAVERAIGSCEQALRDRPDEPEALHLAATLHASAGSLQAALPLARRACKAQPANARYLLTLAKLLNATGDAVAAEPLFLKVLELDPSQSAAWQGLAAAQRQCGRNDAALETMRKAVAKLGEPGLLREYAGALADQGRLDEASAQFEQALAVNEDDAIALNNLGLVRLWQGRPDEAVACFRAALERQPADASALRNLGLALQSAGRPAEALACFDEIASVRPLDAGEQASRGSLLLSLGDRTAARAAFDDALVQEPGNAPALAGKAELLEWEGHYEEGLALLAQAKAGKDQHAVTALVAARLLQRLGRLQEAIQLLETQVARRSPDAPLMRRALFTLGSLYDETGDYERAFAQYEAAHRLGRKNYDPDRQRRWIAGLIAAFSPAAVRAMPQGERSERTMVFVLGMPRSGTSLVEQVLASHPLVHAGGERSDIGLLAHRVLPSLIEGGLNSLSPAALTDLAQEYISATGALPPQTRCITDKMPLNFLYLGLIRMLFPDARIVHCRRSPLDIALSCYFTDFIDPALAFSEDLASIADFYKGYRRLMTHWQQVLDLPVHDVVYEDLVHDQETTTRALVAFLGLPWDERCLRFQETARNVDTASHAQVRRPLYSTSVGRSAHYAEQLRSVQEALTGY